MAAQSPVLKKLGFVIKLYGAQEERNYTLSTQHDAMASGQQMLMQNIHEPDLAGMAIEQLHAAAWRLGELQGLDAQGQQELVQKTIGESLEQAIAAKGEAGETDLAASLRKNYAALLGNASFSGTGQDNSEGKTSSMVAPASATAQNPPET